MILGRDGDSYCCEAHTAEDCLKGALDHEIALF